MEFWPKPKLPAAEEEPGPVAQELQPELLLTPEQEFKGDFESISSPEEFLQAVNFQTLNDIFDTLTARSTGTGEVRNSGHRVVPEKIQFKEIHGEDGVNDLTNGLAIVSSGEIELTWRFAPDAKIDSPKILDVLRTLTHESTHIRGGYSSEEWEEHNRPLDLKNWAIHTKDRVGLREVHLRHTISTRNQNSYLMNLNEAVTENIGQEVLREYLIRTGNSSYLNDESTFKELEEGSYGMERLILSVVLDVLSKKFEVSNTVLWGSMVQAYMSGNQNVMEIFSEISEELNSDPEIKMLLGALMYDLDVREVLSLDSILDRVAHVPEDTKTLNPFKKRDISSGRIEAIEKHIAALDAMSFKAKALSDALGLRK